MQIEVLSDADAVARRGAAFVAAEARAAIAARGTFLVAVSGGSTPWAMLKALAGEDLPWAKIHVLQVDERVAPPGDPDRNLTHLHASLLAHAPLPPAHVHAMPVEDADLATGAARYAATIAGLAGTPAVLDLVHLGLGPDGHTASLVPGDPALAVTNADVAVTAPYKGHRRMTLTFPILDRARHVLWLVTGAAKTPMLRRLREGDATIPAGRVRADDALVLADRDAVDDRVR